MPTKRGRIALPPAEYRDLREEALERDSQRCRCCKRKQMLHSHHLVFRCHGGDDTYQNLLTLCDPCHEAVHERYLLITPVQEGGELDASKPLRFTALNGWEPGHWIPGSKKKGKQRKKVQ